MAIKGKGRTRGRRVVAAPPRPPIMVRKKPWYARRWVWIVTAAVALAGILLATLLSIRSRNAEEARQREAEAVDAYTISLQRSFPPDTQPTPPAGYSLFPTLAQDVAALERLPDERLTKRADEVSSAARAAVRKINAIDVPRVIPEEFAETRARILESRFLMIQAFSLYERIAGLMRASAEAPAASRRAFGIEVQELRSSANRLFERGNQELVDVRKDLGIQTALPPAQQPFPLVPPETTAPDASPQPTGTASP